MPTHRRRQGRTSMGARARVCVYVCVCVCVCVETYANVDGRAVRRRLEATLATAQTNRRHVKVGVFVSLVRVRRRCHGLVRRGCRRPLCCALHCDAMRLDGVVECD
jgi:hypothetical protein